MKWSVVGLIIVGVIAALSAALLVASLRAGQRSTIGERGSDVTVAVAAAALPPMSIVQKADVVEKILPADQIPEGGFCSTTQVIGKSLAFGVVEGQAFTKGDFVAEGTGSDLATALPEGMRAVSISLTSYGGMEGLVYPGSIVDVLVSFKAPASPGSVSQIISMTLLQSVQVLAVESRTVSSEGFQGSGNAVRRGKRPMITLMLAPEQAEALQLAMEYGTISLAMRNPRDALAVHHRPTALTDLARDWLSRVSRKDVSATIVRPSLTTSKDAEPGSPLSLRQWQTTIIRGGSVEMQVLPMPD